MDIATATGASYTTGNTAYATDNGAQISVDVTNGAGIKTSSAAVTLTVNPKTTVLTGPANQTAADKATATFSVSADGTGPFTYQWKRGGVDIATNGTSASYTTPTLDYAADNGAVFSVAVKNAANVTVTSSDATLTVTPLTVTFDTQPTGGTVAAGGSISFTVAVSGTGPFTYQWQKNTVDIPSATAATLDLTNLATTDSGDYTCKVTSPAGTFTSAKATLVVPATVITITTQPVDTKVTVPDKATFTVAATGSNLTYKWYRNGTVISGATSASYTTGATDLQDANKTGTFKVDVSDGTSTITSNTVTLTAVAPNPSYPAGGEPVPVPARALTVVPSLHNDPVYFPAGAFKVGYDEALKSPVWTAYADFPVSATFATGGGDYQLDARLADPQVKPSDMGTHGGDGFYLTNGLGYDRGHMVTRSDVSYRYGPTAGDDATYMSDMMIQVSANNQKLWNDLETAVGGTSTGGVFNNGLTATFGRVWIYSGPVWTGTTSWWVPSIEKYTTDRSSVASGVLAMAVPTANYRIMIAEPAAGQTLPRVMAWLASNRPYTSGESADLWKYVTSVQRIESLTGLDFFPSITHDAALAALKAGVDVRGWGSTFEKATGPNVHMIQPSWDIIPLVGTPGQSGETVTAGTTMTLEAAVSPNAAGGTVSPADCTWNFGDSTGTATGLTTTHVYATTGSYTLTFTAKDSLNQTNSIYRTVTVVGATSNTPPATTPAVLGDVTATVGIAIPAKSFTVSDDTTPATSITIAATSGNPTLIADGGLSITNTAGTVSIAFTPNAGEVGSSLITVTLTDQDGASTVKTFTLTIAANNPPTFTPNVLPDVSTSASVAKNVTFTLADDLTSAGSLVVTATSGNQTLLPNGNITVANVAGAVTLTLTPATGLTGSTLVTVNATDGNSATTTRTFTLTVNSASAAPKLIISQYYEGVSYNKWIEVTNVGDATYDASSGTPIYVGIWTNPNTTNTFKVALVTGTLAPGESRLFKNSAAALPLDANLTISGAVISDNNICNFNGNDPLFLTTSSSSTSAAWDARIDAIGDLSWGTANPGVDKSFYRNSGVGQNINYTASEWTQKTNAEVDSAGSADSWRLGYHVK